MYEPIKKIKRIQLKNPFFVIITWSHRENGEKYMIVKKETVTNIFLNTACYGLITVLIIA